MNGPLKFLTARKTLPLLDLLANFKRLLACLWYPNFCVGRKLAKQFFLFCSCSQKNRSARECSQRPFVSPTGDDVGPEASISLIGQSTCDSQAICRLNHLSRQEFSANQSTVGFPAIL